MEEEISELKLELEEIAAEEKQRMVEAALRKFNFFIHLTGWISGCAFLLIMGILMPWALPYVFIPVGLWTLGLSYHAYRAFFKRRPAFPGVPDELIRRTAAEAQAESIGENREGASTEPR